MSKEIAVQGCQVTYTVDNGSVTLSAQLSQASGPVASNGNTAYIEKIMCTIASGTVNLNTPPGSASSGSGTVPPGQIIIEGTSQKTASEEKPFVLKEDEGKQTFMCIFPASSGGTISAPVTIKAQVTDAGQNVVKVT